MISQRRGVLAIVIGLLLTVVVALGIVVLVALPNLRQGSRILTPDGQRAVKRARQQAKQKPLAAVGSTWHGLVAIERLFARMSRQIARIWAPISEALHEALDRLEDQDSAKSAEKMMDVESGTPDLGNTKPNIGDRTEGMTEPPLTGNSSVGNPRAVPPISGPIPEIKNQAAPTPATGTEKDGRTIDLRAAERSEADRDVTRKMGQKTGRKVDHKPRKVDHKAGSARGRR